MSERPVIDALTVGKPVINAILKMGLNAVAAKRTNSLRPEQVPEVEHDLKVEVAPRMANATNTEPPSKSRVLNGAHAITVGGTLLAVQVLASKLGDQFGWQLFKDVAGFFDNTTVGAIATLASVSAAGLGILMVYMGRLRKGLAPIKGFNPLQWFGFKA